MIKVTHYTNSFISVESDNSILTCDPWIGITNDNGWFSYPLENKKKIDNKVFNSDFIYISHLHCDHLDFKTLKYFKNKKKTFIIKKFNNGVLRKRLEKFSNNIIEINPFKKTKINKDFTISIIPQILSNTSNVQDNINYDLDTSIIIQSNKDKTIFFNNVDNPINLKVLKKINNYVKKEYKKKIDIFCCALGAASEYPQCFINVNRKREKYRIISESLNKIFEYLNYLKPKVFFPAGGTYKIYGKYSVLNKYIAQPEFKQIYDKTKRLKTKIINLLGGSSLSIQNSTDKIKVYKNTQNKNNFNILNKIKKFKYYYENRKNKFNLSTLDLNFENAKINYFRVLNSKKIKSNWKINFQVYSNLQLSKNCNINLKQSKFLKKYELIHNYNNSTKLDNLDCHLEYNLFKNLLTGKFPWNTSLSGSTIMFERNPNKFNLNMVFSLNFLRG